jgi:hypothetical protein
VSIFDSLALGVPSVQVYFANDASWPFALRIFPQIAGLPIIDRLDQIAGEQGAHHPSAQTLGYETRSHRRCERRHDGTDGGPTVQYSHDPLYDMYQQASASI